MDLINTCDNKAQLDPVTITVPEEETKEVKVTETDPKLQQAILDLSYPDNDSKIQNLIDWVR
jgi:hypothetical protein